MHYVSFFSSEPIKKLFEGTKGEFTPDAPLNLRGPGLTLDPRPPAGPTLSTTPLPGLTLVPPRLM